MSMEPILEASNIVKVLGSGAAEVKALKGVSLELMPGELTLLMGPSGSGKTTLLSILGCILSAERGDAAHRSRTRPPGSTPKALPICAASTWASSSSPTTWCRRSRPPRTSCWRSICAARPLSEAPAIAAEALSKWGSAHRAHAYPSKLSGGEKQRVAIARSLAGSPSVILADEPTAALDSENGKAVMALLSEVAKDKGRGILVVTHDHRTLSYADRLIRIEDGKIVGRARRRARPARRSTAARSRALLFRLRFTL